MEYNSIFNNYCGDSVFDQFNLLYGDRLMSICPLLRKFRITVLPIDELIKSHIITEQDADNQAYLNYIEKTEQDASETRAYIGKDNEIIETLCFTREEQFACIAHEIGHFFFFFHTNQDGKGGQGEEIAADQYVCRLGLREPLHSALQKLYDTNWFSEGIKRQLRTRQFWIENFPCNDA